MFGISPKRFVIDGIEGVITVIMTARSPTKLDLKISFWFMFIVVLIYIID